MTRIVLHDVTEMRRLDNVRRDFIANASHELKTPLASMRVLVDTLIESDELDEPRGLELEHGAVPAADVHELVVGAVLDQPASLDHGDTVGQAHGREAVGDEDRRHAVRRREDAVEDLGLAPHVELGGRLVEQHDTRTEPDGAQRARQRDALPLTAISPDGGCRRSCGRLDP